MTVFSSVGAAAREGFHVIEYNREVRLFVVRKSIVRGDRRCWLCALARP